MTRLLVIDDDVTLADLMRTVLEDAGHSVAVATNPRDLPSGRYDCILTDLLSLAGYEVEKARDWIRRLADRFPDTPVIVVTAHSSARDDRDALGASAVVIKPFDVDELATAVREVTS